MKARGAAIQGGLAIIGLIVAYATWQRPKDTTKNESVVVVDATKNSLERVRYEDGVRFVSVEKKDRMRVTLAFLPGKRPSFDGGTPSFEADGGRGDAGILPKPMEPAPDRTVFANERADTMWTKLTPFEASRALGKLPQAKLEEIGLTNTERKLELQVAGMAHRFSISKPVSGLIGNYALDEKSGEVFLVSSSLFNELDPNSQVLVDRRLHVFKPVEFDTFTVKAQEKSATFVQTGADTASTAKVARATSPDKPEEMAKNWHDKIWNRLIVTEVLSQGELPKTGNPDVRMRIDYAFKDKPKGWLELGVDNQKAMWARSENTPSWVAVHQGSEELLLEGQKVITSP